MNKLDYIESYFCENYEDELVYVVVHSLLNCTSDEEILTLYFGNAGNPELKKSIERYIVKRTDNEPRRKFDKIAKVLLHDYPNQDYKTQITIRVFLSKFIRSLPNDIIRVFYELLIVSDRKFDRHRANEVVDLIWDDEVEGTLIDNFSKYKDEYSLLPLVNNLESSSLCSLIKEHWTRDFPSLRMKSKIVKRIYKLNVDSLKFLKEIDVPFYVQALTLKKVKITKRESELLLDSLTEENKYYLIWSIGTTGDWNQTVNLIEKVNKGKIRKANS